MLTEIHDRRRRRFTRRPNARARAVVGDHPPPRGPTTTTNAAAAAAAAVHSHEAPPTRSSEIPEGCRRRFPKRSNARPPTKISVRLLRGSSAPRCSPKASEAFFEMGRGDRDVFSTEIHEWPPPECLPVTSSQSPGRLALGSRWRSGNVSDLQVGACFLVRLVRIPPR